MATKFKNHNILFTIGKIIKISSVYNTYNMYYKIIVSFHIFHHLIDFTYFTATQNRYIFI